MRLFISSLFLFLLLACKKNEVAGYTTMKDVSYGTHAQQKMDVYLPPDRSEATTKVIILIHGGAWNSGDKTDFDAYVDTLKRRLPSYAIFNFNYRLALPPNLFPAQELDVKAAMEFIAARTSEYKISGKFVLIGASAGAHLALLQAYKYNSPVSVKAVVDFFGPTDLVDMYNNPANPLVPGLLVDVLAGTPTSLPLLYQQSSPLNYVSPQSPPTIILQGGTDILVSPSQSVALKNELMIKGVAHQYVFYPAEGHGWFGSTLSDSFDKILVFLTTHVN